MRIQIRDLSPGTIYGLQFRSTNGTAYSEWSQIYNVTTSADSIAPATPGNVTWTVQGTSFLATWDAVTLNSDGSPCNDFSHYQIVLEDNVRQVIYTTNATRFDFSYEMNYAAFIAPRAVVKLQVGAVDTTGNVSVLSTQLTATNPAPSQPANFTASGVQEAIILKWDAVGDEDLKTYKVYMSTTSSSFTPGSGNLVWTGRSTGFSWPSSLYGTTHYFKVAAVDVFDTPSTYASASANPTTSGGVDGTAPPVPTNLVVTANYSTSNALADFTADWTAVAVSDLRGYQIRYRPGTTGPYNFVDVPADSITTIIRNLDAGTSYQFQIQAIDFSGNRSAWSSVVTQSITNVAPSKPSVPTLVGSSQSFRVSHDLTKAAGGNLEPDVAAIEVWVGDTNVWATANPIKVETITVIPGSTFVVTSQMPFPLDPASPVRYVYVKAVDSKGLSSTNSDATAVTITGISGTYIADATIGAAKIVSLEANKLVAGTGVINDILVKSKLTVYTGGAIESKAYTDSGGTSGFRLTDTGLIIKSGSIASSLIDVQASPNIAPAQYGGFEFVPSFYILRADSGSANSSATIAVSGSSTSGAAIGTSTSIFRYESQALQFINSSAASKTVYFANSSTDYNIETQTGSSYIASLWVYFVGSGSQNVTLSLSGAGSFLAQSTTSVPANTWTRISTSGDIPSGTTKTLLSVTVSSSSLTWYFDAAQVEEKTGSGTTPSSWRPPSYTRIDGGAIRTGELRSTTNITVNGVSQPAWSINFQGNAQFGDSIVRGKILVGLSGDPDAGQSKIQSGNYIAGSTGWIIDSSGFAEFRNLAINSIKVTALDKPLQNTVATKLYDYMESGSLWRTVSGSVIATSNDSGAFSASSLLTMTGNSSVARDAAGVSTGIAFEPEVLYRITARVRQLTGDNAIPGVYKVNIGLYGYTDAGVLCGYDGTNSTAKQYMIAASAEDLSIFDGASGESSGWQTFVGYLKGRATTGTIGSKKDQYDPAHVHENVRYIVPFVQLNIGNSTYVAQLDAFTIETFEAGAPNKIATDVTGRRAVTIEATQDSVIDHGIRFYGGEPGEYKPGVIAQFFDNNNGDASSIIISPPSENSATNDYEEGNVIISSRTANYIFNSTFTSGISGWSVVSSGAIAWESTDQGGLGHEDDYALKLTPVAGSTSTSTVGTKYTINPQSFPELIGEEDFVLSAYINPNRALLAKLKITINQTSDTGVVSTVATVTSAGTTLVVDDWNRISVPISFPSGIPDNTTSIEVQIFWNTGVLTTDIAYIDDVQLESGTVATPYKPAASSRFAADTDYSQVRGGLMISNGDTFIIPSGNAALLQPLFGARADAPDSPFLLIGNGLSNLVIGDFAYIDTAGKNRHFSEIGHLGRTIGRQGGGFRIYDEADELAPSRIEIFNKANDSIFYTRDKNKDATLSETTQDVYFPGFVASDGEPPWKTLTLASGFSHAGATGYPLSYYINEQKVYLRGIIDHTGSSGSAISVNTVLFTLPVEARPPKDVYGSAYSWGGTSSNTVLIFINSTTGAVSVGITNSAGRYITFDHGFSYSLSDTDEYVTPGTDTTPPNAPSTLSIIPYSSSSTSGVYTLKWKASNSSDVASTRIVWRSDRFANSATDGKIITVSNAASQNKSYNVSGLPVNKTIYFRLWSIDKAGNVSTGYSSVSRYLLASPVVISRVSTSSWRDSFGGQWRTDTDDVYQGEYSGFNDNHRGLWFYGNQISDKLRVGGITRTITKATIYMKRRNTSHGPAGDVPIRLANHNYSSRPGGAPTLLESAGGIAQLSRGEAATITIPSAWYANIAAANRRGFAIYETTTDYAIMDGASISDATGRLTIYHKG